MNELELERVISRMVDGVATPGDWAAFDATAAREPALWREVAMAQRVQQALASAVAREVSVADRVSLPDAADVVAHERHADGLTLRTRWVASWGGWAAAAAVGLMFVVGRPDANNQIATAPTGLPVQTAAEALRAYQQFRGEKNPSTLVRELPDKVLLDTQPAADGKGYDVTYLRQIVERVHVENLYKPSHAEDGRLVPKRLDLTPATEPAPGSALRTGPM